MEKSVCKHISPNIPDISLKTVYDILDDKIQSRTTWKWNKLEGKTNEPLRKQTTVNLQRKEMKTSKSCLQVNILKISLSAFGKYKLHL